jgi:hypothetical protein
MTYGDPLQVLLPAGSSHDAYVEIRKIMQQVSTEVLIVDSYVDETLWQLLSNVPSTAKIRILTMRAKGDFVLEGSNFAKQHGQSVEVRTTATFHDRFIFVGGKSCWHLGARSIMPEQRRSRSLNLRPNILCCGNDVPIVEGPSKSPRSGAFYALTPWGSFAFPLYVLLEGISWRIGPLRLRCMIAICVLLQGHV